MTEQEILNICGELNKKLDQLELLFFNHTHDGLDKSKTIVL